MQSTFSLNGTALRVMVFINSCEFRVLVTTLTDAMSKGVHIYPLKLNQKMRLVSPVWPSVYGNLVPRVFLLGTRLPCTPEQCFRPKKTDLFENAL